MLDKEYIIEAVRRYFPDLVSTKFTFNDTQIRSFSENILLPFLIYQNTVDNNHRLIGLFLPENCSSIHMVPFYIIMGQYRKALEKVMYAKNFQNQSFSPSEKQVVFNGDICSISSVDFINRQLTLRSGQGREYAMSFLETYKLKWNFKNAEDVRDKVDSFDKVDKAGRGNIFTFPIAPKDNQYEGVIIYTGISKFESLLRNIRVSGSNLKDQLNIEKVIFPSGNEAIKFTKLSTIQASQKPVSVLIARQDAFRTYDNVLKAGKDRLKHIRTIIIDDFDDLLNRWEKLDTLNEELDWLKENYFQKLQTRELKDIYLISRNSRIDMHAILKSNKIEYNPWLLLPQEENFLDNGRDLLSNPSITLTNVGDAHFENLNEQLEALTGRWKVLAQTSFCSGEIISPINSLYELRDKLNTFFSPENLKEFTTTFLDSLEQLRQRWFYGGQDYNTIEDTKRFAERNLLVSEPINYKLESIITQIIEKKLKGPFLIVGDNSSSADVKWLLQYLSEQIKGQQFYYIHRKDYLNNRSSNYQQKTIFYLRSDKRFIGLALGNPLAERQIFILNSRAYTYTEHYIKKFQRLQKEVGSDEHRYTLLNVKEPETKPSLNSSGLLEVEYNKRQVGELQAEVNEPVEEEELQEFINEIIRTEDTRSSRTHGDKCLLFFDDGSLIQLPENKHVFLYEEEIEPDDIDKLIRIVSELKKDDQIILPKRGLHIKDLLIQALKKNSNFLKVVDMDEKWRLLMSNHIKRCGMDLSFFRKKLQQNGFSIGTDYTIKNWIDGETRRPDNFVGLLSALASLGIIRAEEIHSFDRYNSELKSIQIRFVRMAIEKLVSKFNGIDVEEDEVFTDDLLSEFIDHIEIKKIISIYKL